MIALKEYQANLIDLIQEFEANIAIGASTVRGKGNSKVAKCARAHLAQIDLARFSDPLSFAVELDRETVRLRDAFPPKARKKWGLARKCMNIFLRQCVYNGRLARYYGLARTEKLLELPLDGDTVGAVKRYFRHGALPRWSGVEENDAETSEIFQVAAQIIARKAKISRVHLDVAFWRNASGCAEVDKRQLKLPTN